MHWSLVHAIAARAVFAIIRRAIANEINGIRFTYVNSTVLAKAGAQSWFKLESRYKESATQNRRFNFAVSQMAKGMGDMYEADASEDLSSTECKDRLRSQAVSMGYTKQEDINRFVTEALAEAQIAIAALQNK
jgi:hypothetical protein